MSKVFDCPKCGEQTCVADNVDLNYCMYCGNAVKGNWYYLGEKRRKEVKQISLFDMNTYKKHQAWNGG